MSSFTNVCAVIPVADHTAAVAWYKQWLGRGPDVEPDEGVAEWKIAGNAWLQVSQDSENAGKASVVIGVEDIDAHVSSLSSAGVRCGEIQDHDFIKLSELTDTDGNKINFVWENPNFQPPAE